MINRRKEWTTVGPYAPNPLGNTRATMAETMGSDQKKEKPMSRFYSSFLLESRFSRWLQINDAGKPEVRDP